MSEGPENAVSVVVMHHPKRAAELPDLLRDCGGLAPRVVTDPDPTGPPSPLRTAKRAWAAIPPNATHHLVLQDDVQLIDDFDRHLIAAVAAKPESAISLHIGWHSAPNSYFVRLAAAVGSPWAALSPSWTPTYGLVLPAAAARELAAHLETVPDEVRDDDRVITPYLAARGIDVLAPVPHLLEHSAAASVAGNTDDGVRRGTVFLQEHSLDWAEAPELLPRLAARVADDRPNSFAVELHNSECRIRFSRPGSGEALSHAFGWSWYDWCPLIGVDPASVLDGMEGVLAGTGLEPRVAIEVWAAAWLLGFDAASLGGVRPLSEDLMRAALLSWIESGLCGPDLAVLDDDTRHGFANLAMTALTYGGKA